MPVIPIIVAAVRVTVAVTCFIYAGKIWRDSKKQQEKNQ